MSELAIVQNKGGREEVSQVGGNQPKNCGIKDGKGTSDHDSP